MRRVGPGVGQDGCVSGQGREHRSEERARSGARRGSEPESGTSAREVTLLGLDRLDRHPGHRRGAPQPGPVPGHRSGGRRRRRRPARRAGADARRRTVAVARATAAQDLQRASTPLAEAAGLGDAATARCRRSWPVRTPPPSSPPGPCDIVLNGITGSIGLAPTLAALEAGPHAGAGQQGVADRRRTAGDGAAAKPGPDRAGRLRALRARPVPARRRARTRCASWCSPPAAARSAAGARDELAGVTLEQALAHPTWDMGPVVTINSATLVNKGLEVIEAHLLFDVPFDRIEVVVHPQSIVHSMVEFADGVDDRPGQPAGHADADRAGPGAGRTGCRTPRRRCDWTDRAARGSSSRWTTRRSRRSPGPGGRRAGGIAPGGYNAANEECVAAFLAGRLPFPGSSTPSRVSLEHGARTSANPPAVEDVSPRRTGPGRAPGSVIAGGRAERMILAHDPRHRRLRGRPAVLDRLARARATSPGASVRHRCRSTWSASARPSGRAARARPSTASRRSRSAATSA